MELKIMQLPILHMHAYVLMVVLGRPQYHYVCYSETRLKVFELKSAAPLSEAHE